MRRCGLLRLGLHVLAAVDGVDLAGDESGVGVGEELDDPGDLVGFTEAPGGDLGDDLLAGGPGNGGDHLRGDVAGRDGDDGDALAGGLLRQAHGQAEQTCLGRGVVGLADVAGLADDRADVDDAPGSAVEHVLQDRSGQVERTGEVHLDDAVPVVRGHPADGLVRGDACVVDQDVEAPVLVEDLADDTFAVLDRADVALVHAAAGMGLPEQVGGFLVAGVPGGDGHPAGGEPVADRRADAPDTAGDQGYLSVHVGHVAFPFERCGPGQAATRSSRASPCPPPPHRAAAPSPPPRRRSSRARCSARRAPEAPTGCPMAMAPPLTLTASGPTPRSRIDWMATAANASFISNRSTSAEERPCRPSAFAIALAGWDSNEASGPATVPWAPISASTGRPSCSALVRLITTTAAAPSESCEAFPAVTVPSAAKAGRSLARLSVVVPGRMPSSSVTSSGSPFRCGTGTGAISSSNDPALAAAAARSWLIAAYSSCSARVRPLVAL